MTANISIIIPCFNEEDTIQLLLTALSEQTYPQKDMEIIIADGMSQDNTRSEIKRFKVKHADMNIRVIDNRIGNIPAALNTAIKAAKGDIFIRMDAHAIPQADYVERCVKALQEGIGDNVGGVWDIHPRNEKWIARSIAVAAAHPLGVGDAQYRFTNEAAYVDTVPFGAFKRDLIDKIGPFDETLLSNEDYEFNTRIRESGGRIWLDPSIRSIYYARPNLDELSRQYWRYGFWKAQMLKRYPKTLRLRQAIPPLFVLSLLIFAIAALLFPLAQWLMFSEALLYILVLMGVGIQVAIKEKQFSMLFGVPLAIATMHLNWGAGFIRGIFTRKSK